MSKSFTDKYIRSLKPKKSSYYVSDNTAKRGVGRLMVKVQSSGRKTFCFRYYKNKKPVFISIGDYPDMKLVDASYKASEYGQLLTQGIDPQNHLLSQKLEAEQAHAELVKLELEKAKKGSVLDLINSYTDDMKAKGKSSHAHVKQCLYRDALPILGKDTNACDVKVHDIKRVIASVIARSSWVQSNRIRSYLSAAYNFGIKHDNDPAYMDREAIFGIEYNPVAAVPAQDVESVGDRELNQDEICHLWADLSSDDFTDKAMAIGFKLMFATGGQRPIELSRAKWENILFDTKVWDYPIGSTKNKRSHVVPLTDLAIELFTELKALTGHTPYLFPMVNKDGHIHVKEFTEAMANYRKQATFNGRANPFHEKPFTPRDIRRTVKTRMGELHINKETRDRINNHAIKDVSDKHYDRYDYIKEKRDALEFWCDWLDKITKGNLAKSA